MVDVRQTEEFSAWLHGLRDASAVARVVARIRRMEQGNPGDTRSVGKGVMEKCVSPTGQVTACTTYIAERRL